MHAATTSAPDPAMTQLSGLYPPSPPASMAGSRKIPAPSMELAMSATRLHRPIVRTRSGFSKPDFAAAVKPRPSFRRAHIRRPAFDDFAQHIGAVGRFEVRIALSRVIVDGHGSKIVFVLDQQRDRL